MNTQSVVSIEKLLELGSLDQAEARMRASLVFEDFQWIGFKSLRLAARPCPIIRSFCISEYHFGNTGFSIDYAEQAKVIKSEWIGGTGLDRGHLQMFSRLSLIARELNAALRVQTRSMEKRLLYFFANVKGKSDFD